MLTQVSWSMKRVYAFFDKWFWGVVFFIILSYRLFHWVSRNILFEIPRLTVSKLRQKLNESCISVSNTSYSWLSCKLTQSIAAALFQSVRPTSKAMSGGRQLMAKFQCPISWRRNRRAELHLRASNTRQAADGNRCGRQGLGPKKGDRIWSYQEQHSWFRRHLERLFLRILGPS